jgi:hypothetical protein
LVTAVSGGALDYLFSVLELDPFDDLGELLRPVEAALLLAGRLAELQEHYPGNPQMVAPRLAKNVSTKRFPRRIRP